MSLEKKSAKIKNTYIYIFKHLYMLIFFSFISQDPSSEKQYKNKMINTRATGVHHNHI